MVRNTHPTGLKSLEGPLALAQQGSSLEEWRQEGDKKAKLPLFEYALVYTGPQSPERPGQGGFRSGQPAGVEGEWRNIYGLLSLDSIGYRRVENNFYFRFDPNQRKEQHLQEFKALVRRLQAGEE